MKLPLWFRKWIGSWWGSYCEVCGDKFAEDQESYKGGWGIREWCENKKCPAYKKICRGKL